MIYEGFSIDPENGEIEVEKAINYLKKIPYILQDFKLDNRTFFFCANKEIYDWTYTKLKKMGSNDPYPFSCMAVVTKKGIGISLTNDKEELKQVKDFVSWVIKLYECKIYDNELKDYTKLVKEKGIDILFEGWI
jgi:hypothetical protein